MTIVICDSSLLILVSKLEIIDLLLDVFERIIIPHSVYIESVEHGKKLKKLDAFLIEKRIEEGKIVMDNIKNISDKSKFIKDFNLHEGESEAIVLYLEKSADLLGTDDYRTIKVCKILNITYFTTLSFIHYCYKQNLLSEEKTLLKYDKLNIIGWYKEELISYFKNKIQHSED